MCPISYLNFSTCFMKSVRQKEAAIEQNQTFGFRRLVNKKNSTPAPNDVQPLENNNWIMYLDRRDEQTVGGATAGAEEGAGTG